MGDVHPNESATPLVYKLAKQYDDGGFFVEYEHGTGLTIRAEFAARALQGMLANVNSPPTWRTEHDRACAAVAHADALIAALNAPRGEKP